MPTGARITCQSDPTDEIAIEQDEADRFVLRGYWGGQSRISVITDRDGLRSFVRDALEMVGEVVDNRPIKVGDRVRVTADSVDRTVGRCGRLTELDDPGSFYPYLVKFEDRDDDEEWVRDVVKDASSTTPFATRVDEAKRLLAGTEPTAADIITLARELAERA